MKDSRKIIRPTLKHIAQRAGVSISTVSDVLKNRTGKVQVSESTRSKIVSIARDLDYHPNSAAHTLATGRTYNVGFLLSSKTTLGLANYYFSSYLSGVQAACKERGYACVVSAYDLSSLENLVVPDKIRKKKIDGAILTGYVEDKVLDVLLNYNIPFILVGESIDYKKQKVLTVSRNMTNEWKNIFNYLYNTGCRHIGVADVKVGRIQESLQVAVDSFTEEKNGDIKFEIYKIPYDVNQFEYAAGMAKEWLQQSPDVRVSAMISHDQWCTGFLSVVAHAGIKIPDELSIVSTCDTVYCEYYNPRISALKVPLFEHAKKITYLLTDYIDKEICFDVAQTRAINLRAVGKLIVRETSF